MKTQERFLGEIPRTIVEITNRVEFSLILNTNREDQLPGQGSYG